MARSRYFNQLILFIICRTQIRNQPIRSHVYYLISCDIKSLTCYGHDNLAEFGYGKYQKPPEAYMLL